MHVETVCGVPVVGYYRVQGTNEHIPMIETETDIQWVKGCIRDREEHPEHYPDEDVPAVIAQQKALLEQLRAKAKEPRKPKQTSGRRVFIDVNTGIIIPDGIPCPKETEVFQHAGE